MKKTFLSIVAVLATAVMMFSCKEPAVPAELKVEPASLEFSAQAGSKEVTLYSALEWSAEITLGSDWITLSEMSGVAMDGKITVSVADNTNATDRNGKIVFKSGKEQAEVAVTQKAKSSVVADGLVEPEPIYRPDVFSPVPYVADMAEGGMDGVTIEITGKDTSNFKFQVRPGANVQSYRLDVYPLCRLYNSLYENARQGGSNMNTQLSEETVESMIRGFIFDSSGAGAYTFSVNNMEDYMNHEFDWMNTPYAQAKVVPDCEYVIAAVGCFDADGADQGDITLCYVRTPYKPLIGSPAVGMDIITTFDAMQVTYLPNDDCKYFYQWVSNESDLQPYIDAYGDKMYIDFMRNAVYDPTSREDVEAHNYYINFGLSASAEVPLMATAVGLDKNFTPSPEFQSEVFQLKQRPAESEDAVSMITVDTDHIAAGVFWLDVELGANCSAAVMKIMSPEEAENIKGYSEAAAAEYAQFLYQDGWGFGNTNYLYNRETDELLGSGIKLREPWVTVSPDSEYVIVWTAMNQYKELAPLQFTDVIRTKPIIKDQPEMCTEDVVLTLTHTGVQQVNIAFEYSFEKTSKIHFQYIEGFGGGEGVNIPVQGVSSREEFISFLYADGEVEMGAYSANHWYTEPSGKDKWTDILDPNTTYTIAYVAEDWNGYLGEVKFATTKTEALQGGDNPQASLTGNFANDGTPYFQFAMGQDAMQLYYMSSNDPALNFKDLGNKNKLRYKDILPAWENFCMEYSLKTYGLQTQIAANHGDIALCIPVGGSADAPVFGSLLHLIYVNEGGVSEFRDLGYYYPEEHKAANSVAPVARQSVLNNVMRSSNVVRASELPEVESGVRNVRFGKVSGEGVEINLDYKKLSSHPNASGR
ncbi:MAG: BACON domain-containing protein [Tidjanibacter sp.]|nr:BACON domain-containing protein [Tidjanibacter sp.]